MVNNDTEEVVERNRDSLIERVKRSHPWAGEDKDEDFVYIGISPLASPEPYLAGNLIIVSLDPRDLVICGVRVYSGKEFLRDHGLWGLWKKCHSGSEESQVANKRQLFLKLISMAIPDLKETTDRGLEVR
ncbi:MAG TPA: hypothetical protein VIH52_01240 [Candidatus Nanoarchaeia archaeon]|nr:hypothetical protein [uncultured archaeon]